MDGNWTVDASIERFARPEVLYEAGFGRGQVNRIPGVGAPSGGLRPGYPKQQSSDPSLPFRSVGNPCELYFGSLFSVILYHFPPLPKEHLMADHPQDPAGEHRD